MFELLSNIYFFNAKHGGLGLFNPSFDIIYIDVRKNILSANNKSIQLFSKKHSIKIIEFDFDNKESKKCLYRHIINDYIRSSKIGIITEDIKDVSKYIFRALLFSNKDNLLEASVFDNDIDNFFYNLYFNKE